MADDVKKGNGQSEEAGNQEHPPANEGAGAEKDLRQQLEEAQKTAAQLKDQLLRKAAEFENYKRRNLIEQATAISFANEEIMVALLPILNDFARSLKSGQEQKNFDAFYKGVELIYHKLIKTLEKQGLRPFDSLGKPFDVDLHDALMQVPRSDVPPNIVTEEVERGYKLHDRVIRHARVVVSSDATGKRDENGKSTDRKER